MPELPEVETVRRGLLHLLAPPLEIRRLTCTRADLRHPLPGAAAHRLLPSRLTTIRRRGKYLLWELESGLLLNHLSMSGSWRLLTGPPARHDHCLLDLADGRRLAYRDPRRFGDLAFPVDETTDPRLCRLGPEPFDPALDTDWPKALRSRRTAIKSLLLDQGLIAGIGNIYANEALFRAGIRPHTSAATIGPRRARRLLLSLRTVLREAIAAGGSTISDFRHAGGSTGYFQHCFQVYGRSGLPCQHCARPIRSQLIGGRASFYCPRCQG